MNCDMRQSRSVRPRILTREKITTRLLPAPPVPTLNLEDMTADDPVIDANQNSLMSPCISEKNCPIFGIDNAGNRLSPRERHSVCVASCLFEQWQDQRMCDLLLSVDGQDFPAHRLAFAAHSHEFSSKFCSARSVTDVCHLPIPNCTREAVGEVLKFVYTSEINLTVLNVDPIISCAKYLEIPQLIEISQNILLTFVETNALLVMKIARKYELLDIYANIHKYICQHFNIVTSSDIFFTSSIDEVCSLLSDDSLKIERELEVFLAAMRWLEYDWPGRHHLAKDVLSAVRFVHISPEEMVAYIEPTLSRTPNCQDILTDVFRFHALKYSGSALVSPDNLTLSRRFQPMPQNDQPLPYGRPPSSYQQQSCRMPSPMAKPHCQNPSFTHPVYVIPETVEPPCPYTSHLVDACTPLHRPTAHIVDACAPSLQPSPNHSVVIASGGVSLYQEPGWDAASKMLLQYCAETNKWTLLSRMPDARHHHGCVVMDNQIYVIGGSLVDTVDPGNMANPTSLCSRYNPVSNNWTRIASLAYSRMLHGVSTLGGVIYALGGQNREGKCLSSVEFYNPDINEWGETTSLSEAKIGIATTSHRGCLYIVGGFVETQHEKVVVGNVECFDPRTNRWTSKNPLPGPRCHAGLVEACGCLYLVGGSTFYDDSDAVVSLDAVLRLDDEHDCWSLVTTMKTPRHDAGVSAMGHHIYIVGGLKSSDNKTLLDVEVLDVSTNRWLDGVDRLAHKVLGLACCTLNQNVMAM